MTKKKFATGREFRIQLLEEDIEKFFEEAKEELKRMPYMPKDFNNYTEDDWDYLAKSGIVPYEIGEDCIFYYEKFCNCDKWTNLPLSDYDIPEEIEEFFWKLLANELKKRFLN